MTEEMRTLCRAAISAADGELDMAKAQDVVHAVLREVERQAGQAAAGTAQSLVQTAVTILVSRITGGINLSAAVGAPLALPSQGIQVLQTRQGIGLPGLPD